MLRAFAATTGIKNPKSARLRIANHAIRPIPHEQMRQAELPLRAITKIRKGRATDDFKDEKIRLRHNLFHKPNLLIL